MCIIIFKDIMKHILHKYSFQDENNVVVTDSIEVAVSNMSNDDAGPEGISTAAVVLDSNNTDEQDGEDDGEEEENDDDDDDDDEEEDDDDDEEEDDDEDEDDGKGEENHHYKISRGRSNFSPISRRRNQDENKKFQTD